MAKLYPPIINGTIPAFYGDQLMVPFSMNPAVGRNEVAGFSVKIKGSTGDYKCTIRANKFDNNVAFFSISKLKDIFLIGQYYKVQLAYISTKDEVGYYSSIGITKYTSYPDIYIDGLNAGGANSHQYNYTGVFSQKNGDQTEKMYSSFFRITDSFGNIITESKEQIHNFNEDILNYEQRELFSFLKDLEERTTYKIQFFAKSLNEISNSNQDNFLSSPEYQIFQNPVANKNFSINLFAELDEENGVVELTMGQVSGHSNVLSGSYMITRRCKEEMLWEEFKKIDLDSTVFNMDEWLLLDTTVEQGKTYQYGIQQFNDYGLKSQRIESNFVFVDFEYIFLSDGQRQLKIKYNPKVSSFKNNILESKTDAIGNKYPIISRNGYVKYKEFPISGLLSYHEDDDEYFITKENLGLTPIKYTRNTSVDSRAGKDFYQQTVGYAYNESYNLIANNFYSERNFKQNVLDWLNNGKIKVFRSASEGNYLIRLMNVSLSPIDNLGRMIHSFSGTAYEVDDFTLDNLRKYNLISDSRKAKRKIISRKIALSSKTTEEVNEDGIINLLEQPALKIKFDNLSLKDLKLELGNNLFRDSLVIAASKTTYEIEFTDPILYVETTLSELEQHPNATLEIWYDVEDPNNFTIYKNVSFKTIISEPHYGHNYLNSPTYGVGEYGVLAEKPATPGAIEQPARVVEDYFYKDDNAKESVDEHNQIDVEMRPEVEIIVSSGPSEPPEEEETIDETIEFIDNDADIKTPEDFSPDTLYKVSFKNKSCWVDGETKRVIAESLMNGYHTISFGTGIRPLELTDLQPVFCMTSNWLKEKGVTSLFPGIGVILRDTKTIKTFNYIWEDPPSKKYNFTPIQSNLIKQLEDNIVNCELGSQDYEDAYKAYIQFFMDIKEIEINEIVERLRNLYEQYAPETPAYDWGYSEYVKFLGKQACKWERINGGQ